MEEKALVEQDKKTLWHPFTQAKTALDPLIFVKGEGANLFTKDGRGYIDATASWWVNLHGHAQPHIASAIAKQAKSLEHMIFTDFTHEPAISFATRLIKILPKGLSRVFYSDNGSTAVEAALKMALQYWVNQNSNTKRTKIISFKGGYHGDTFGAMSVSGKTPFNAPFWPSLFESICIDPPYFGREEASINQLRHALRKQDVACFIYEPLIQGVGGMRMHCRQGLNALIDLCRKEGVLLIADEVMTGFGRTGPLFSIASAPDIICLSKGITGGFIPLGATIATEDVYNAFLSDDRKKAFLHGHSYCGNPIALAAALSSLDLTLSVKCTEQRTLIEKHHKAFCKKWEGHPMLSRVEHLGTILVLEYATDDNSSYYNRVRDHLYRFFLDKKILLRPLGNVVYVLPPYCIAVSELDKIYQTLEMTLTYESITNFIKSHCSRPHAPC